MSLSERDTIVSQVSGVTWPYAPLLDALNLAPTLDILDVGASDGGLLRELRRRGHSGRLVGIDPEPGTGVHLGVQQASVEALPFTDASFDVVIFLRVLAHLPQPEVAMTEARRVLKPGGLLVIAANGPAHLRAFWSQMGRVPAAQTEIQAQDIHLPVVISSEQAHALAQTYLAQTYAQAWPADVSPASFADHLHLALTVQSI